MSLCKECSSAEQLFRVRDWELRGRVVLQGLDRWPLQQCIELLQFCLSDQNTQNPLREQLQQRKHELDMYQRVSLTQQCSTYLLYQYYTGKNISVLLCACVFTHVLLWSHHLHNIFYVETDTLMCIKMPKSINRKKTAVPCHLLSVFICSKQRLNYWCFRLQLVLVFVHI